MRTKAAVAVVALLALAATGTPAAFAKGSVTIDKRFVAALKVRWQPTPVLLTRKDRMGSCQVGLSRKSAPFLTESQRKTSVVACEQPPRSSIGITGSLSGGATLAGTG